MNPYDPLRAPDPESWLELDEQDRIDLVLRYHRRAGVKLPNARLHAVMHVIVENQSAMGDETRVRRTLARLQNEGLDRHDAVHAVGSVLAGHLWNLFEDRAAPSDPNDAYSARLDTLTAESWRRGR